VFNRFVDAMLSPAQFIVIGCIIFTVTYAEIASHTNVVPPIKPGVRMRVTRRGLDYAAAVGGVVLEDALNKVRLVYANLLKHSTCR
jgi:hypothetical protein